MSSISQTLAMLARKQRVPTGPSRLAAVPFDGPNPGGLRAFRYLPEHLPPKAPLVVVLHGCMQNAGGYDRASGWSTLADRAGFALLYPEQQQANNPNACFNWFSPADAARGNGEARSIIAMIDHMVEAHDLDRERIFVTGLSAGGAMAASLLASYPEVFLAGAIIAGIPHGVATSAPQAFRAMRGQDMPNAAALQNRLERASPHRGPWPRIAIWHGSADTVVAPANADALFAQWQAAHDLGDAKPVSRTAGGARHAVWQAADGQAIIERWDVPGMGHGTPLGPNVHGLGSPAPYMLDVGLCSTSHIATFFGVADAAALAETRAPAKGAGAEAANAKRGGSGGQPAPPTATPAGTALVVSGAASDTGSGRRPKAAQAKGTEPEIVLRPVERDTGAEPAKDGVGSYVNAVLEQHLPGNSGLYASIKQRVADALQKAGLR